MVTRFISIVILLNICFSNFAQTNNEEQEIIVHYANNVIAFTNNNYNYLSKIENNHKLLWIAKNNIADEKLKFSCSTYKNEIDYLEIKHPLTTFSEKDQVYLKNDLMLYDAKVNFLKKQCSNFSQIIIFINDVAEQTKHIENYIKNTKKVYKELIPIHKRIVKTILFYAEPANLALQNSKKEWKHFTAANKVLKSIENPIPYIEPIEKKSEIIPKAVFAKTVITLPTTIAIPNLGTTNNIPYQIASNNPYLNGSNFIESINVKLPSNNYFNGFEKINTFPTEELTSLDLPMLEDLTLATNIYNYIIRPSDANIIVARTELNKLNCLIAHRKTIANKSKGKFNITEVNRFNNFYRSLENNFAKTLKTLFRKYGKNNNLEIFTQFENIKLIENSFNQLSTSFNESRTYLP